jgi:hypothetical protein
MSGSGTRTPLNFESAPITGCGPTKSLSFYFFGILIKENADVRLVVRIENDRAVEKHAHRLMIVDRRREFYSFKTLLDFILEVGAPGHRAIRPRRNRLTRFADDRGEHDRAILLSLFQQLLGVDAIHQGIPACPQDSGPKLHAQLPLSVNCQTKRKCQAEKAEKTSHSAYASH